MYLNERAWKQQMEEPWSIRNSLKSFLDIYVVLARDYYRQEMFVPADDEPYLRSQTYSVAKWLSEVDPDYRRIYLSFWQKRIIYTPEEDYEAYYKGMPLLGGTEAILNDSFMISICFGEEWRQKEIRAAFYSVFEERETSVIINNVYDQKQLKDKFIIDTLSRTRRNAVYSYDELWERREVLFHNLRFCPSVKKNLECLELFYINQIISKLSELNNYKSENPYCRFKPELLSSKVSVETQITLDKYQKEHTFSDEAGKDYLASWHMRFTGIQGRIFFVPDLSEKFILICYIGKKLPNVTYPT